MNTEVVLTLKNLMPMKIYLGGGSAALKPLNQNQQYKKQLEICYCYVFHFLYMARVRNSIILRLIKFCNCSRTCSTLLMYNTYVTY